MVVSPQIPRGEGSWTFLCAPPKTTTFFTVPLMRPRHRQSEFGALFGLESAWAGCGGWIRGRSCNWRGRNHGHIQCVSQVINRDKIQCVINYVQKMYWNNITGDFLG